MSAPSSEGPPEGVVEPDPAWTIVDALRRYGSEATRLNAAFSARHELQPADVQALVAILSAEGSGEPLTPRALRAHLGLSSGGTSYVIDRLERAGHVRRHRDHPTDNRVVHLRHTEQGRATGSAFFGPLGARMREVMMRFDADELAVVARFLQGATDALGEHVRDLESGRPAGSVAGRTAADEAGSVP